MRFGLGSATLLLLLGCSAAEPRERPATPAADCPSASVVVVEKPAAEAPPSASAPAPAPPVAAREMKEAPREPFLHAFPGDVELEITFGKTSGATTVSQIRHGDRIVYPPACGKTTAGLCSRAHRTIRGEPGGDERDDMFEMGPHLLLLSAGGEGDWAGAFFAATFIGSPICSTHAFWELRADAKGVRVSEPIRGCFPGATGEDQMTYRIFPSDPPTYVFRSMLIERPDAEVVSVYTFDERTMTFTRRFVGKTAKTWPNAR